MFYLLAAALVWLSFKSLLGGIDYLRFFKQELNKPPSNYSPFATVIVPCKGLDPGLAINLGSLTELEYPEYEIILAVDDVNDPAASIGRELLGRMNAGAQSPTIENPGRRACKEVKLVVAPKATASSQKVENLREAVLHMSERSEVLVFADSDTRPSAGWLRSLISPLKDAAVGAATGYRWFIADKPSFASELRCAWNASIASALGGNEKNNFCWGGSMAIRRELFERLDVRNRWHGTLSDDFAVTRALRDAGHPIVFVPQALTATVENASIRETLEFTTRQMKITRVYAPHLWRLSFAGSLLFSITMVWALIIVAVSSIANFSFWAAFSVVIAVTAMSVAKAWLRLRAAAMVLGEYPGLFKDQFWPQVTFWLLTVPLFLYNCVSALLSRKLRWRGIDYELISPTETKLL